MLPSWTHPVSRTSPVATLAAEQSSKCWWLALPVAQAGLALARERRTGSVA